MYVSFQDICWNASSFPFPFLALAQEAQGLNSQPAAYPHSWGVRQLGDSQFWCDLSKEQDPSALLSPEKQGQAYFISLAWNLHLCANDNFCLSKMERTEIL